MCAHQPPVSTVTASHRRKHVRSTRVRYAKRCQVEHSNSGKKSFDSIRFGNLINLPLVHWYSNSKLGVIFYSMHCVTVFWRCSTQYSFQLRALWCILIKNHCIWCVCVIYLVQRLHNNLWIERPIFLQNESIRIKNRIDSIRIANWNALVPGCIR